MPVFEPLAVIGFGRMRVAGRAGRRCYFVAGTARRGFERALRTDGQWPGSSRLCLPRFGSALQPGLARIPAAPGPDGTGRLCLLGHGRAGEGRGPVAPPRAVGRGAAGVAGHPSGHRGEPHLVLPGAARFGDCRGERVAPRFAFVCQPSRKGRARPRGSGRALLRPGRASRGARSISTATRRFISLEAPWFTAV